MANLVMEEQVLTRISRMDLNENNLLPTVTEETQLVLPPILKKGKKAKIMM